MFGSRDLLFGLFFTFSLILNSQLTNAGEEIRVYHNTLKKLKAPSPLLADHPEFIQPIEELRRFEAPLLVDDEGADLSVRAWRFSYNARGIIEIPNKIRADKTAVIMVHPWGIDDGQGWKTPEPAGAADFCTPEKNHLAGRHTREVIDPFLKRSRKDVALVMYSLIGKVDPIRKKLYRTFDYNPTKTEREQARKDLAKQLKSLPYQGEPLPNRLTLSKEQPVIDYFKQFSGLSAGDRFNGKGFWNVPVPVTSDVTVHDDDVLIFDQEGYEPLKKFLKKEGIRHVLLTGYATDMCFCKTTAGYENLSRDFNVFLVGDASLATFPANSSPKYATNAHISFASLNHLITQVSWIKKIHSD
ncbi:isochorismatase family protein [Gimesia aquarii]|uniref:Isochorismatase family protein n=1 Tax=Gimesia aquarii TaxID=2527964 RepID=A0A517VNT3_9PLAN|nr:isochorismatase family protein [Gimesia aquarii]QDT94681.1 Isochorismatase family protein [Gimesia aquarii]